MASAELNAAVEVVTYQPRFAEQFASLNYQWIERYFAVEDEDRKALEDPQGYAISRGGEIFFLLEGDDPVGTVAMVPVREGTYELAKMAVRPDRQGKGYGRLLMQTCIEFARRCGAREIMLVTNDILTPALGLYESAGFVALKQMSDIRYARGNLQMQLELR